MVASLSFTQVLYMKHDLHDFATPDALILKESLWGHSLSSYMHVLEV